MREASVIGLTVSNFNPNKPFSFADYPITHKRIDKLLNELQTGISTVILNGIDAEWTLANNKNSELANVVFGDNIGKLTQEQYRRYYSNNHEAREAFIARKDSGLNLSDRVWRYSDQFKTEIEMGLDLGIRNGMSADEMSRDLRDYLQNPDKLFRRVRDAHGQLHLSKAAMVFHPGAGVYRSSYKNAMRLTRTETNIAYRTADFTRWQQLDFVVGIEIRLSNNHPCTDICDILAGKYPKDFKFTGWHPQCMCYAIPILKTMEEMQADNERIMNGEQVVNESTNSVSNVPKQFEDWTNGNAERISRAKSHPYFVRDNAKYFNGINVTNSAAKGIKEAQALNKLITPKPTTMDVAAQRHVARTAKQVEEIQGRWSKGSNIRAVERRLGITQGKPMTFEAANELKGNINYGKSREYSINCQSCVVANELRRRGFDVTAFGKFYDEQTLIGRDATIAWTDPITGKQSKRWHAGITDKGTISKLQQVKDLNKFTQQEGRYTIGVAWTHNRGRHIITAERLQNSSLVIYDPQSGLKWSYEEWIKEIYNPHVSKMKDIRIQRIDNLLVNESIIDKIVTATM